MPSDPTRRIVVLAPGEYVYGDPEVVVQTLLGSCIAFTFWHPRSRVGAMCHYMLPSRPQHKPIEALGRYGEDVLLAITEHFQNMGYTPGTLQVRMFGGSNMFPGLTGASPSIGDRNIEVGRELTARLGYRLTEVDLGGPLHRRVIFEIASGRVDVQYGEGPLADRGGRR